MLNEHATSYLFHAVADFLMAMLAWALFFLFRKYLEGIDIDFNVLTDKKLLPFGNRLSQPADAFMPSSITTTIFTGYRD
ncbi:MAG: hypothetical protein R2778_09990 [Saprospiraceae bacterium]